MADLGRRRVDPAARREPTRRPNAELGLLEAPEAVVEASERGEHVAAHRHVRGDQVAHAGPRHPLVGAADHPLELAREPAGSRVGPDGLDLSTHPEGAGIAVCALQLLDPAGVRLGVVVEEPDDVARRPGGPGVPGPGGARALLVLDHQHAGQPGAQDGGELGVVVDHHDHLARRPGLGAKGRHRPLEVVPTLVRVAADHDGDRGVRPRSPEACRRCSCAPPSGVVSWACRPAGEHSSHARFCKWPPTVSTDSRP